MERLDQKVTLVTGAGAGIGAAIAEACARQGAFLVVADLDSDAADKHASHLREQGLTAVAMQFDLGDSESVRTLITRTVNEYGRLDVLVNNAAATNLSAMDGGILDADEELWDSTFQINVRGTMVAIKHAARQFIDQGHGGVIVNMSSAAGVTGDGFISAYGASKAAIINLTRHAATQLGVNGIRVNAVVPGLILTPKTEPLKPLFTPHQAINRNGQPEDIANAVVFLASDESAFITGHSLNVDGGLLVHMPYMAALRGAQ